MEPLQIYSLIQAMVKKEINDAIEKNNQKSSFEVIHVPDHTHNGVDSSQIDFINITGLPIITAVPTDFPEDGTIRLYNTGGVRRLYAFISGVWYSVVLT